MLPDRAGTHYNVGLALILCTLRALSSGWSTLFIALETPRLLHWCSPPPGINQAAWRSYAIPTDHFGSLSQCTQYPLDAFFSYHGQFRYTSRHTPRIECRSGRSFETFILGQSVTAAFDLVCESAWIRESLPAADLLGSIVGYLVLGKFADCHGRKKVALCSAVACALLCLLGAFSPSVWGFFVSRFLLALSDAGIALSCLAFLTELLQAGSHMAAIVICFVLGWIVPSPFLGLLAWVLQDFRYTHLCLGAAYFLCVPLVLMIRESPDWLLAKSETDRDFAEEQTNQHLSQFNENGFYLNDADITVAVIGVLGNQNTEHTGKITTGKRMTDWPRCCLQPIWMMWLLIFAAGSFAIHNDLLAVYQIQDGRREVTRSSSGYRLDSTLLGNLGLSAVAQLGAAGATIFLNNILARKFVLALSLILASTLFIVGSCIPQHGHFVYLYFLFAALVRLLLLVAEYTQVVCVLESTSALIRCSTIGACLASAYISIAVSLAISSGGIFRVIRELFAFGCLVTQVLLLWFMKEANQSIRNSTLPVQSILRNNVLPGN